MTIKRSDVLPDIKLTTRKSLFTNNRAVEGLRYTTDGYILFDREAVIPKYADLARRMAARKEEGHSMPRTVKQEHVDPLLVKKTTKAVFEGYIEADENVDMYAKKMYPLALVTDSKSGDTYAFQGRLVRLLIAMLQPHEYGLEIKDNWHALYLRIGGSVVGMVAGYLVGDPPIKIEEDAVERAA